MKAPTISELRNGPPMVSLLTAAACLGIGRTKAYELAKAGKFPVRPERIGGSYRVPVAELLRLLRISETAPQPASPPRPAPGALIPAGAARRIPARTRPY